MACLSDPELPVRVQAAEALAVLIDHSVVRTAMAPNAGRLMQELLKLSDETDLDVLTQAKEKIVANFSEELLPFAVEITQHMANSFMRLVRENMASADAADGSMEGAISFGGGQEEDKSEFRGGEESGARYDELSTDALNSYSLAIFSFP